MTTSLASALPTFSGNVSQNVDFFIDQINSVEEREKWPNEKKLIILKIYCRDKALDFLANDSRAAIENDFENLEKLLKDKFSQVESFQVIQQKFSNFSQKCNQSVRELADEITTAATKYINEDSVENLSLHKLKENMKLTKFLDALRADIRIEVKKLGLSSFDRVIELASNIENALNNQKIYLNSINAEQNLERHQKIRFHVNESLHTVGHYNHTQTIIENNTNEKLILRKNSVISTVVPFHFEDIVSPKNHKTLQINTLNLQEVIKLRKEELNVSDFKLDHLNEKAKSEMIEL
ncbi:hypothetical protein X975_04397, partial [Stegodyphus mimosarum]